MDLCTKFAEAVRAVALVQLGLRLVVGVAVAVAVAAPVAVAVAPALAVLARRLAALMRPLSRVFKKQATVLLVFRTDESLRVLLEWKSTRAHHDVIELVSHIPGLGRTFSM